MRLRGSRAHYLCLLPVLSLVLKVNAQEACYPDGPVPGEGSCCQFEVCGIPCGEPIPSPPRGYGIAVVCFAAAFTIIGFATYFAVKGKAENFFVAGRSLPLWVVTLTLASQSLDSNALLGNVDLSYKYHFWDGCVLPLGLGLSLLLNGIFLAKRINEDNVFTLPDIFAKRYGKIVEVLVSLITIVSFLCLLAGNLVGMGAIIGYLLDITQTAAIWASAAIVLAYTACGGLFSVAYTDVMQASCGMVGVLVLAFYLIATNDPNAPPPSIGFPGYTYPDSIGDGGICDAYQGVACENTPDQCCYNDATQTRTDNGAYPIGDQRVFNDQMTNAYSLTPFPNAIFWNWCTIFILAFGNLAALDFQARCMASKTPNTARYGCFIAGCLTFLVGIPFSFLGAITRVYYGPDSQYAEFAVNSCSNILGLPSCAEWVPDAFAFVDLLANSAIVPKVLGGWALVGIVAASMSTADGAILAMGTVFSHNIMRNIAFVSDDNLLLAARIATIPLAAISALVAAFYRSARPSGATGYLLIVAFDVVFASVVVPLFGCFYAKKPSPTAALFSTLTGAIMRVILEFTLPKDGYLILPFSGAEFLKYGPIASISGYPSFIDVPQEEIWDQTSEPCHQEPYRDYTGLDSMSSAVAALLVFLLIQFVEHKRGPILKRLANHRLMQPYSKSSDEKVEEAEKAKTVETENVEPALEKSSDYETGPEKPVASVDTPPLEATVAQPVVGMGA